jgi:hypothetical protein
MYNVKEKLMFIDLMVQELGNIGRACDKFNRILKSNGKADNFSRVTYYNWLNSSEILDNGMTFADMVNHTEMKMVEDADVLLKGMVLQGNLKAVCFYLKHRHPEYRQKFSLDLGEKKQADEALEKLNNFFNERTNKPRVSDTDTSGVDKFDSGTDTGIEATKTE